MRERLAAVQADQERIKSIYNEHAGISPEAAENFFLGESNLTAAIAKESGIVHELRQVQIPAGSPVVQLVFNRKG